MCLSRLQVILSKVSEVPIDLYWHYTVRSMVEKTWLKITRKEEFWTVFLTMSVQLALSPLLPYNFLTFDLAFFFQTQKLALSRVIVINVSSELVLGRLTFNREEMGSLSLCVFQRCSPLVLTSNYNCCQVYPPFSLSRIPNIIKHFSGLQWQCFR